MLIMVCFPTRVLQAAVLFINTANKAQQLTVPLADVPKVDCANGCLLRDVWAQTEEVTHDDHIVLDLAVHQTAYFIISPVSPAAPVAAAGAADF